MALRPIFKIVILILLIASFSVTARELAVPTVRMAGESFLHKISSNTTHSIADIEFIRSISSKAQYYVAHLKPSGFIILSSNDEAPPVIAYSYSRHYGSINDDPLRRLLEADIRLDVNYGQVAVENEVALNRAQWKRLLRRESLDVEASPLEQWPPPGTTSTGGWIETTWHQKAPYNSLCPVDPETGEKSLVGCVAVAMAQIVNFHRFLGEPSLTAADSYTQDSPAISYDRDSGLLDFPSFDQLNNIIPVLQQRFAANDPPTQEEAAALLFLCGLLTRTEFSSTNSITFTKLVAPALTERLGYMNARKLDFDDESFFETIITNIMNGQPIQIAIDQKGVVDGHSAVVDGYNSEGFFHINFGWGDGTPDLISEAWYLIPDNMGDRFDLVKYAIADIVPSQRPEPLLIADSAGVTFPSFTALGNADVRRITLKNLSASEVTIDHILAPPDFSISMGNAFNQALQNITLSAGAALQLDVQFRPVQVGWSQGDIMISYNNETTFLRLTATGYGVLQRAAGILPGQVAGVWSREHSPYYVMGDVEITPGQKLTINSGVRLYFEANARLTVNVGAQLLVRGTQKDSVIFRPIDPEEGWQGIRFFNSGDDDSLFYAMLSGVRIAEGDGGALYCNNSSPFISNSSIFDNVSPAGAGASLFNSSAKFENVIFHSNQAEFGGAVYAKYSQAVFDNVTVADNVAKMGGAFYADSKNDLLVTNSIVWANGPSPIIFVNGDEETNRISVSYSDMEPGETSGKGGKTHLGHKVIHEPPHFRSQQEYDYRLQPQSPCIDAGNPAKAIGAEPMPHGYCVNLGAYGGTSEAQTSQRATPTIAPDPIDFQTVGAFETKTMPVEIGNGTLSPIRVQSISVQPPNNFTLRADSPSFDLAPGERQTVWIEFTPSSLQSEYIVSSLSLLSSAGAVTVPIKAHSQFSGNLSGVLGVGDSPYIVHGPLRIPDGETLIIEPGVKLLFQKEGAICVSPEARLIARGSEQAPILFDALDPEKGWQGVVLQNSKDDDLFEFCHFENVKRETAGGAVSSYNSSPSFLNTTIRRNHSYSGAALYAEGGTIHIFQCRLEDNATTRNGAGLYTRDAYVVVRNTLFINNESGFEGGALYMSGSKMEMVNCVVSNNRASQRGGALSLGGRNQIFIQNTILWENDAGSGTQFSFVGTNSGADFIFLSYSNIDTTNSLWFHRGIASVGNIEWQKGCFAADPMFVNPLEGDFRLSPGSPCIDAGNPAAEFNDPPSLSRMGKAAFPGLGGLRNDLGVYGGLGRHMPVESTVKADQAFPQVSCFPNPFNERTVIQFVLKEQVPITIRIFDLLGRRVRMMVDGPVEAGLHRIAWDGRDSAGRQLPSGTYFLLLESPAGSAFNKLLILR